MIEQTVNGRRKSKSEVKAKPKGNTAETEEAPAHSDESDAYVQQRHDLAERLAALRAEFREIIANYAVNVQGAITQLGDELAEPPGRLSSAERKSRTRALRQAVAQLDDLDLKPSKGRRRDLKKVEKYVARLSRTVADW